MKSKADDKICNQRLSPDCVQVGDPSLFHTGRKCCKPCNVIFRAKIYYDRDGIERKRNKLNKERQKYFDLLNEKQKEIDRLVNNKGKRELTRQKKLLEVILLNLEKEQANLVNKEFGIKK